MQSQRFGLAVFVLISIILVLSQVQCVPVQEVEPTSLPTSTTTIQEIEVTIPELITEEANMCDTDFEVLSPTDLTFGSDGALYVTDAENGVIYRCNKDGVIKIAEGWHRPYGIAALPDGTICVGHYDSEDPLFRRSSVSCWDGNAWHTEIVALGNGITGVTAANGGLWVASWQDTPVESRDGLLTLISESTIVRQVELPERFPQFLVVLPTGDILVSVWQEDASGFTGGEIWRVSEQGDISRFSNVLDRPSGLAYSDKGVWAADYLSGELVLLSFDGERVMSEQGLDGPLGLKMGNDKSLCVVESHRGRITCLEIDHF